MWEKLQIVLARGVYTWGPSVDRDSELVVKVKAIAYLYVFICTTLFITNEIIGFPNNCQRKGWRVIIVVFDTEDSKMTSTRERDQDGVAMFYLEDLAGKDEERAGLWEMQSQPWETPAVVMSLVHVIRDVEWSAPSLGQAVQLHVPEAVLVSRFSSAAAHSLCVFLAFRQQPASVCQQGRNHCAQRHPARKQVRDLTPTFYHFLCHFFMFLPSFHSDSLWWVYFPRMLPPYESICAETQLLSSDTPWLCPCMLSVLSGCLLAATNLWW